MTKRHRVEAIRDIPGMASGYKAGTLLVAREEPSGTYTIEHVSGVGTMVGVPASYLRFLDTEDPVFLEDGDEWYR